jgi:ribonucleoside-diphosphate reductase alpha chain
MQGRYVPSLLAAIGGIIERHMGLAQPPLPLPPAAEEPSAAASPGACCPRCGAAALIRVEGCSNCLECGYSKCG